MSDASRYVDLLAKLDTGSTYCIFNRSYATLLGLDLSSGISQRIRTATGDFQTYGHEVTVSVFDLEWQAVVYFAESDSLSLNVLGRFGFLDRLRIAVVDYDEQLYLGLYGQE
jgi:predicted aspartyl protease